MLDELRESIRTELEGELLNAGHTSILLMRQLLIQAEKWHLKMALDIADLENRELLEQVLHRALIRGAPRVEGRFRPTPETEKM